LGGRPPDLKKESIAMPTTIAAVQRCLDAYTRARSLAGPDDAVHGPHTLARINCAYRRAMPFLTPDPDAIDTFIACVIQALRMPAWHQGELDGRPEEVRARRLYLHDRQEVLQHVLRGA
jgi:hypothetical protein